MRWCTQTKIKSDISGLCIATRIYIHKIHVFMPLFYLMKKIIIIMLLIWVDHQKRFYARGTLISIRISRFNKIPFIVIGWDPWNEKRIIWVEKNVHKFTRQEHKFKKRFCTKKLGVSVNVSLKDFWYTKINLSQNIYYLPLVSHYLFFSSYRRYR